MFSPGQGPRRSFGPGAWYGCAASYTNFEEVSFRGGGGGDAPGKEPDSRMKTSISSLDSPANDSYAGNAFVE